MFVFYRLVFLNLYHILHFTGRKRPKARYRMMVCRLEREWGIKKMRKGLLDHYVFSSVWSFISVWKEIKYIQNLVCAPKHCWALIQEDFITTGSGYHHHHAIACVGISNSQNKEHSSTLTSSGWSKLMCLEPKSLNQKQPRVKPRPHRKKEMVRDNLLVSPNSF